LYVEYGLSRKNSRRKRFGSQTSKRTGWYESTFFIQDEYENYIDQIQEKLNDSKKPFE